MFNCPSQELMKMVVFRGVNVVECEICVASQARTDRREGERSKCKC